MNLTRKEVNFFFVSRRRHTRLQGDWSSDVCSSDLNDKNTFWRRAEGAEKICAHDKILVIHRINIEIAVVYAAPKNSSVLSDSYHAVAVFEDAGKWDGCFGAMAKHEPLEKQ